MIMTKDKETLLSQPLAFSSDASLRSASSRVPLETSDGALLNVEIFEPQSSSSSCTLLLVIPGICESAETKGVQAIVQGALDHDFNGTIAVMELEGHGLSSGTFGVCPSFERLVGHVVETAKTLVETLFRETASVFLYLVGNSLGGALAIYAADELQHEKDTKMKLQGIAPVAPAVGMNPKMLPPSVLVYGLKALAFMIPTLQVSLTPYEDPSHYNCPENSTRNFTGHWPLATSKMLLDVTSETIPTDIASGKLQLAKVPSVLVIAGASDAVVPVSAIQSFYEGAKASHKDIVELKKTGHDLMFQNKSSDAICTALFEWIQNPEK